MCMIKRDMMGFAVESDETDNEGLSIKAPWDTNPNDGS